MNIPDHISESLETIFWVKIIKFFDADADPRSGTLDPGWKKIGSVINIRNTAENYNNVSESTAPGYEIRWFELESEISPYIWDKKTFALQTY